MLALDGWLANRTELIRTLGLTGGGDTLPDTSVIAAALQLWGGDALPRLHGDFAIVWWDRVERRLLLACDRTGGRTLFYHAAGTRLFFANVTGALFVHPDVPRTLNPTMVARSAFSATVDFEDTCFAGIRQLLPGRRLDWSPAGPPRVSAYWRLDLTRRCRFRRDEDYVEAGRELLDTVVGEAARTDGVLASLLSGGLDSTAVAATAARLTTPTPLHTITVRPDPSCALPACGPRAFQDEWSHAQAVARLHPSMVAHAVFASPETLEDDLQTGFYWTGRPPFHLLGATWMAEAWRQVRRLGASVLLTGLSGNGTLSASALPVALRAGWKDWPEAARGALLAASLGRPAQPLLRAMAPGWLRRLRTRRTGAAPVWRSRMGLLPEAAGAMGMEQVWEDFLAGDPNASLGRRARLRTIERTWTVRTLASCLRFPLGFERRDPLGDVRLAEFCLAIPSRQFTRFGRDRDFARRVLADRLPPEVLLETRTGRQGAEWFDRISRRRAWVAAELDGIEASALGREMIDVPRLRAILDDWPADADAAELRYHELMSVLGGGLAVGGFIRWAEGSNR